jgi:hypothetical protein
MKQKEPPPGGLKAQSGLAHSNTLLPKCLCQGRRALNNLVLGPSLNPQRTESGPTVHLRPPFTRMYMCFRMITGRGTFLS